MIHEVYVSGFRSLEDIRIPLARGLNILVGPNGGGKTNILSFFEFLSKLTDEPVDEAVSSHGGIGRIFTRLPDNKYKTTMEASIRGSTLFRMKGGKVKTLYYTWKFEISASESYDEIEYSSQRLYVDLRSQPQDPKSSDLIISTRRDENGTRTVVDKIVMSRMQHLFRGFFMIEVGTYLSQADAIKHLSFYSRTVDMSRQCLVTAFPSNLSIFKQIAADVKGGEIFNFVPEICKLPEDSARLPIIGKNGAGVASTLHRLGKPQNVPLLHRRLNPWFRRDDNHKARLRKISSYVALVSPAIKSISTAKNVIDNTISVFVSISEGNEEVLFPLAQCSDGTVKWIAILTKVITANTGYSLEEPENFLHPHVQKEFVNVVRTETSRQGAPHTLITTHSESILNEAKAEEVILVWMEHGKTVAKRVSNASELTSEINRTGFGLGYYYAAGALEGD